MTNTLTFTDWELCFLSSVVGNTVGDNNKVSTLWNKLDSAVGRECCSSGDINHIKLEKYAKAADKATAPKKTPLQLLLENNSFAMNGPYYSRVVRHGIIHVKMDGTAFVTARGIDFEVNSISTQDDIIRVLGVFN